MSAWWSSLWHDALGARFVGVLHDWSCLWFTPCRLRQTTCLMACLCLPSPQSGEAVKELYSQLGEKLEQLDHRKPSPTQAAETPALELPLPSVPAPATL